MDVAVVGAAGRELEGAEDWALRLLCTESLTPRRSTQCRHDRRVLRQLQHIDHRYVISSSPYINGHITVRMRTRLGEWLYEVCVAEDCDESVFPQTMNCVDRVMVQLSRSLRAAQFQLLGCVCLFIVSKLRDCSESVTLSAKKLAEYSDDAFTSRQLTDWELVVLQALKWDVAGVTAADFVDVILGQLSLLNVDASRRQARVRQHALTFIVLCALDFTFSMYAPSTVAAACVRLAVTGVFGASWCSRHRLDRRLLRITNTDQELLMTCQEQLERYIESRHNATAGASAGADDDDDDNGTSASRESRKRRGLSTAVTPTDVRDISLDHTQSQSHTA